MEILLNDLLVFSQMGPVEEQSARQTDTNEIVRKTLESLQAMMLESSLAVTAERGVRVLSDYLPSKVSRSDEYERVFELERKLSSRPEFAAVARYTHFLARRTDRVHEGPVIVIKDGA